MTSAAAGTADTLASAAAWRIWGHEWAVEFLQGVAAPDEARRYPRLRHAYLFTGMAALGKSTLARQLAISLLCPQAQGAACGTCAACRAFRHGNHPDFLLVDPVDGQGRPNRRRGLLRVEQAEAIMHHAMLRPFQSPFRIVLIRDLQQAHPAFANKLLKTFEEPPAAVVLLATATDASHILPTLVSRCQLLPLRPMHHAVIREVLVTQHAVEAARADLLARLAHGRMGWALAHLQDDALWTARDQARAFLERLVDGSWLERLGLADDFARRQDVTAVREHVEFWHYWWRDVWLWQHGQTGACINVDCLSGIEAVARHTGVEVVTEFLQRLEQAQIHLRGNVNARLVLTNLMLHMPQPDPRT